MLPPSVRSLGWVVSRRYLWISTWTVSPPPSWQPGIKAAEGIGITSTPASSSTPAKPASSSHHVTPFPRFCIYWRYRIDSISGACCCAVSTFPTQCLVYHRYITLDTYSLLRANIGTISATGTPTTVNNEHRLPLHGQEPNSFNLSKGRPLADATKHCLWLNHLGA